jgi:RNA polymerase sigma factor (sigma-70 family)
MSAISNLEYLQATKDARVDPAKPIDQEDEDALESDSFAHLLLRVARFHAGRRGLTADEAEDCAVAFVERMLRKAGQAVPRELPGHCFAAWLHRCAANFATSYCRARAPLGQNECPWPETLDANGSRQPWDCADNALTPEASLLREEFWRRMTAALEQLSPAMRELLVRHHLHDECIQEIAVSSGRTPHAVEQTLVRARRRQRAILERMGLSEPELRVYIAAACPLQTRCLHPG